MVISLTARIVAAFFLLSGVLLFALPDERHIFQLFVPENSLWREDGPHLRSNVSQPQFEALIKLGLDVYTPVAGKAKEKLAIKGLWKDSKVNAKVGRNGHNVTVTLYGGIARRPELTLDGLALVMCHELGHAYGGEPYLFPSYRMSAEGQADYYATNRCLNSILQNLAPTAESDPTVFMERVCAERFGSGTEYHGCLRALAAGESVGKLLSAITNEPEPNYETPDPRQVEETETSYPGTVQCRVDTYLRGLLREERPACWFKSAGRPLGVVVGENDLRVVTADGGNVPEEYRPMLDAVGLMSSGCTATHIGNGLVLSAGHCYTPSPRASRDSCSGVVVWWGHRDGKGDSWASKCKRIIKREYNGTQDFILFKVDRGPAASVSVSRASRVLLGAKVTIFSHPRGRPLEWSGFCKVDDWADSSKGLNQFNHQCDTEAGSSGAAIIDTDTLQLVGIHNGGGDGWNYATFSDAVTPFIP